MSQAQRLVSDLSAVARKRVATNMYVSLYVLHLPPAYHSLETPPNRRSHNATVITGALQLSITDMGLRADLFANLL